MNTTSTSFPALQVGDYVLYLSEAGAHVEQATDADRQALLTLEPEGLADRTCDPALLAPIHAAADAERWSDVLYLATELEPQVIQAGCWGTWAQLLEQMHGAALKLRDQHAEARTLHQLGVRALCLGDQVAARSYFARAFRLRQNLDDRDGATATCALLDLVLGPPTLPPSPVEPMVVTPQRRFSPAAVLVTALLITMIVLGGMWGFKQLRPTPTPQTTSQPTATLTVVVQVINPTATTTFIFAPTATPMPSPTPTSVPTDTPLPTPTRDIVGPPPPALNQPAANAVSVCAADKAQHTVRFQWSAVTDPSGIKRYELVLSEIAPRSYVYPTKTFTGTQPVDVNLPCNVTYRWRVRAVDGAGNAGGWSEERQFTLADKSAPPAPDLVAPAHLSELDCLSNESIDVLFKWTPVSDPSGIAGYEIKSLLSLPGVSEFPARSTPGTQPQVTINLRCGGLYDWSVRAIDGAGNAGEWSTGYRVFVRQPLPDLVVEGLQTTGPAQIDDDGRVRVPITFAVHNRGGINDNAFTVAVIYAPESTGSPQWFLPAFDAPLNTEGPLFSTEPRVFSGNVIFEAVEQGKTVDVQIIADSCLTEKDMPGHCRVLESNESNNGSTLLRLTLPKLVTTTLRPVADATVDSRMPTRAYGNADLLVVDGGEYPAEALLRFDLSAIPPGAQIRAATLHVPVAPQWSLTDPPVTVELVQVQEDWTEETVNWTTRPTLVPPDLSDRPVYTLTVGTQDGQWEITRWVEEWIAGQPHRGIALRSQGGRRVFSSRESAHAPRLVIEYVFIPTQGTSERGPGGFGLHP